jgi:hypothetical protein
MGFTLPNINFKLMLNKTGMQRVLQPGKCWNAIAASGVGLITFLAYLRTMAPTVYGLDSAELTSGAYSLGIVHAPGSPLYLLIGFLFSRLPFGDVGYRLNLFSACSGAVCAVFFYLILRRLAGGPPLLAALCAIWVAITYYFWITAVAAELYAPASCFLMAVLFLAVCWYQDQRPWQLRLMALLFGLSLGIHMMLILAAPGLAFLVIGRLVKTSPELSQNWGKLLRQIAVPVGTFSLGAMVYLYLPIRYLANPSLNYARDYWQVNLASWNGFWWMVTGRMFSGFMFSVPLEQLPAELAKVGYQLWSNFSGLGLVLGIWGLVVSYFRRERMLWVCMMLIMIGNLVFYVPYSVTDKDTMMLPVYLIWGLWMGAGILDLAAWLYRQIRQLAMPLVALSLLATIAVMLVINFPLVDLSKDWSAREKGETLLPLLARDAWFIGSWEDVPILEYFQIVEKQRPDIHLQNVIFTGMDPALQTAYQMMDEGFPVYTSIPAWFIGNPGISILQTKTGIKVYQVIRK